MMTRSQKIKHISHGILWMVLWLFSMNWIDTLFYSLVVDPDIPIFMLIVMVLFCMWKGIYGFTQSIIRLAMDTMEDIENDSERED